jgi:hypothetical protein
MTEHEEMLRGEEADRLLANPLFKESISKVREGIVSSMEQSALGDEHTHNRLVIALQLLSKIEKNIREVAETGKMVKIQIESKGLFSRFK